MDLSITGTNVLVTGGTRGIGRAISRSLAAAGASVVACYGHDSAPADALERELKETAGRHAVVRADVTSGADLDQLVCECERRLGTLDAVVLNAGTISHVPFAELSEDEWRRVLDTNLTASFLTAQRALPLLRDGASVVFVGSRVATVGVPLRAHYTAAKAGLIGLARSLAKELGPRGIRVNVVAPGPVETEAPVAEETRRTYERKIALRRLGKPEEIAAVVLFLVSGHASFINGETVHVDGGI